MPPAGSWRRPPPAELQRHARARIVLSEPPSEALRGTEVHVPGVFAAVVSQCGGSSGLRCAPMPQPPQLTPEQREAALAKAAEARRARAELKEKLKMGSLTLKELLDQADANDTVGKMKVLAVLESLPGVGKVRARRAT